VVGHGCAKERLTLSAMISYVRKEMNMVDVSHSMVRSSRTAGVSTSVGNGCFEEGIDRCCSWIGLQHGKSDSSHVRIALLMFTPSTALVVDVVRETRRDYSRREALI